MKIPTETAPLGFRRATHADALRLATLVEEWGFDAVTPVAVSVFPDLTLSRGGVPDAFWTNKAIADRLAASPGFAVTAILTLALAIAGTTAMVGVVDALLLRPLPLPSPDRLVLVWTDIPSQHVVDGRSAFGTVDEWRRRSRSEPWT